MVGKVALTGKRRVQVNEAQIKHMAERFLGWKLPENFNPDGGISFEKIGNKLSPSHMHYTREPSGTNLLDYTQATAMVEHMLEGLPVDDAYDRGRRDVLNAILAVNPDAARKLHDGHFDEGVEFTNAEGKLPFDVVFWVTTVADQLGIEPRE